MKSLLLVEDDKSLGTTLSERLAKDGLKVTWAEDLASARGHMKSKKFDVIVLDVGLPDGSGFDFAKEVRVGSSRVDLQACKLEYSIVSPK